VNISLRLTEGAPDEIVSLNSITELDGVLEAKVLSAE
jgi:chorismate mutase